MTISKGELLLITVEWREVRDANDRIVIQDGQRSVIELDIKPYTSAEIQTIIDEAISDTCSVVGVDRYDMIRRVGEDISEDFDIRTQEERDEEEAAEARHDYIDYRRQYSTLSVRNGSVVG